MVEGVNDGGGMGACTGVGNEREMMFVKDRKWLGIYVRLTRLRNYVGGGHEYVDAEQRRSSVWQQGPAWLVAEVAKQPVIVDCGSVGRTMFIVN